MPRGDKGKYSDKQKRKAEHIAQGYKKRGVSAKTAESHRSRIMTKLKIHETAGLVRYAIRQGLIQP